MPARGTEILKRSLTPRYRFSIPMTSTIWRRREAVCVPSPSATAEQGEREKQNEQDHPRSRLDDPQSDDGADLGIEQRSIPRPRARRCARAVPRDRADRSGGAPFRVYDPSGPYTDAAPRSMSRRACRAFATPGSRSAAASKRIRAARSSRKTTATCRAKHAARDFPNKPAPMRAMQSRGSERPSPNSNYARARASSPRR